VENERQVFGGNSSPAARMDESEKEFLAVEFLSVDSAGAAIRALFSAPLVRMGTEQPV